MYPAVIRRLLLLCDYNQTAETARDIILATTENIPKIQSVCSLSESHLKMRWPTI